MSEAAPAFRPVAVIPVYDHYHYLPQVVAGIRGYGLPVILVDDGSHAECRAVLEKLAATSEVRQLVANPCNQGKGAATIRGFQAAAELGFTHAFQIDADGQHGLEAIPAFLQDAQKFPEACICGYPVYDASVPAARLQGRKITNWWVHINSLSADPRDAMCGFRIYPLATVIPLVTQEHVGSRMEFDPEIAVRIIWRGIPIRNLPVHVTYPQDGVSHFRVFRDNVQISCMHARLCCGMLWRLPLLLARRLA